MHFRSRQEKEEARGGKSETLNPRIPKPSIRSDPTRPAAMASAPVEKLKSLWNSQVMDEEQWAVNYRVLKAAGIFAGSIFLMRTFGDMMVV